MSAPARAPHAAGFTLLELLVAITLFALLSVVLFGGLRFGLRATEAGTARIDRTAEIAAAAGFLRNELADAQPLEKTADGDKERAEVAFTGEPGSIIFVAAPPPQLTTGGWHVLHLALEPGPNGGRLVISGRLVRNDAGDDVTAAIDARSVLLEHVASVSFAFFGTPDDGDPPEWHERWEGSANLPALVRLRIGFADGSSAPELMIALRAAAPVWRAR